jgi:hypothetical protein
MRGFSDHNRALDHAPEESSLYRNNAGEKILPAYRPAQGFVQGHQKHANR